MCRSAECLVGMAQGSATSPSSRKRLSLYRLTPRAPFPLSSLLLRTSGWVPAGGFLLLSLWGVVPPALFAEDAVLVFSAAFSAFAD